MKRGPSPCPDASGSLDRKPQRPLLGKSRTLPSIPQSPVLSRLPLLDPTPYREEMPEQKPYKKHSASDCQKGCTVPSTAADALGVNLGELVTTRLLPAAPVNRLWELLPRTREAGESLRDGDKQDERLKDIGGV
ncbi:hypothetical protein llap_5717 [Limosa lapponica baueri]|uniref:Uncharacterized protein n=1 Tax=Limosa lapponica baueri TaxID=1758121 RepID=A0A2I0UD32_LIMLA|nr:hypothetical protein llap_5717 [Limosa lapponica baueri]